MSNTGPGRRPRLWLVLLGWTALTLGGGSVLAGVVTGGDDAAAIVGAFVLPAIWLVGLVVLVRRSRSDERPAAGDS